MAKIKVTIGLDSKVKVEVEGVAGKSCTDVTKELEKALGTVEERKLTADYHKAPRMGSRAKAGQ